LLHSYHKLRSRADRFIDSVTARYSEMIDCRPGCAECCVGGLTVVMVEAAALGEALGIAQERIYLQAGQPPLRSIGACTLLDERGRCRVYPARPLICRTQGMPLRYPDSEGISVCRRNFVDAEPHGSAVFDMANLETALFACNLDYCQRVGLHPMSRVAMDRLAQLAGLDVVRTD
jgi:hypothetical protein